MIAQYALAKGLPNNHREKIFAALALLTVHIFSLIKGYSYVKTEGIVIGYIIIAILLLIGTRIHKLKICKLLICTVSIIEIAANCFILFSAIIPDVNHISMSSWKESVTTTEPVVDYVKEYDDTFYRMEKTFQRSNNDAMFYSYNGLSHFSSTEQTFVPIFLEKLGFKSHRLVWAYYNTGSTAEVDSFLGVKYVLSKNDLTSLKGYKLLKRFGDIGIYQNINALPIAMYATPDIYTGCYDAFYFFCRCVFIKPEARDTPPQCSAESSVFFEYSNGIP